MANDMKKWTKEDTYMLMLLGRKAICPTCSGVLQMMGEEFMRCIDCHDKFEITGVGRVEGEVYAKRRSTFDCSK